MPAIAAVSPKLAVKVLKKYISYFANGLPAWSSEVWQLIQKDPDLKGKWKIHSVRTNINKNRNNILHDALKECGIPAYSIVKKPIKKSKNKDISSESEDEDDYDDSADDSNNENSDEYDIKDQKEFIVKITRDEWNKIKKPEPFLYNGRKFNGFTPKVWSNKLSYAFWKQHHLKCAFVFKKGKITENVKNYATISGYCKAKNCKNQLKGIIKDDPGNVGPVYIKMHCRDTSCTKHDDVKRPLNGAERLVVQKQLMEMGVSAWRKKKAKETKDTCSPFLYSVNTLYQAKKEAMNKEFDKLREGLNECEHEDWLDNWIGLGKKTVRDKNSIQEEDSGIIIIVTDRKDIKLDGTFINLDHK